jgi:hypothetical protein
MGLGYGIKWAGVLKPALNLHALLYRHYGQPGAGPPLKTYWMR